MIEIPKPWEMVKENLKKTGDFLWNAGAISPHQVYDFSKAVVQGTAQSGGTVGLELHNRLLSKAYGLPEVEKMEMPGFLKPLFGEEPVATVKERAKGFVEAGQQVGVSEKVTAPIATPLIIGLTALDFLPGGKAAKEASEQVLMSIARTQNIDEITKLLKPLVKEADPAKLSYLADELRAADTIGAVSGKIRDFYNNNGFLKGIVRKVTNLIPQQESVRKQTEVLYSAERTKRLGRFIGQVESGKGTPESFRTGMTQLGGELPKPEFTSMMDNFSQVEYEELTKNLLNSSLGRNYELPKAFKALNKMLGIDDITGKPISAGILQPNEIELMKEVFGSELAEALVKQRGKGITWGGKAVEVLNTQKAFLTATDMSPVFRQMWSTTFSHPIMVGRNIPGFFKYLKSPQAYDDVMKTIANDPLADLAHESGLALTKTYKRAVDLSEKEEVFQTNFFQNMRGPVGATFRGFERGTTGLMNKVRFDFFKMLSENKMRQGITSKSNPEIFKGLATIVNTGTGRGTLSAKWDKLGPALNTAFWSVRFTKSRIDLINPFWYARLPKGTRMTAVKESARTAAVTASVFGLLKMSGFEVGFNPKESKSFLKVKVPGTKDTWVGFTGGLAPMIRMELQMFDILSTLAGKKQQSLEYKAISLLQGKMTPAFNSLFSLLIIKKSYGEKTFNLPKELLNQVTLLSAQDLIEVSRDASFMKALGLFPLSFVGFDVSSYGKGEAKKAPLPGFGF